jgi:hypothetical protein
LTKVESGVLLGEVEKHRRGVMHQKIAMRGERVVEAQLGHRTSVLSYWAESSGGLRWCAQEPALVSREVTEDHCRRDRVEKTDMCSAPTVRDYASNIFTSCMSSTGPRRASGRGARLGCRDGAAW